MSRKADIKTIMTKMNAAIAEEMQDLTISVHRNLRSEPPKGTPIDVGYATNKWWFAVNNLPARITDPNVIDTSSVSAAESGQQQSMAAVLTYQIGDGPLFVYNDTNYIEYLVHGSSKQSPAGFDERAVAAAVSEINQKYGNKTVIL